MTFYMSEGDYRLYKESKEVKVKFELSPEELARAKSWYRDHLSNCPSSSKSITYCFAETGIGVAVRVECSCGDEEDVTDYDLW